jgi:hypothetical protein
MRPFSGDGPARQFEAGQQRGDHSAAFVVQGPMSIKTWHQHTTKK